MWSESYTGTESLLIKMGTRQTNKCLPYITSQNRHRPRVFDLCTKEKVTNALAGLVYFSLCVYCVSCFSGPTGRLVILMLSVFLN